MHGTLADPEERWRIDEFVAALEREQPSLTALGWTLEDLLSVLILPDADRKVLVSAVASAGADSVLARRSQRPHTRSASQCSTRHCEQGRVPAAVSRWCWQGLLGERTSEAGAAVATRDGASAGVSRIFGSPPRRRSLSRALGSPPVRPWPHAWPGPSIGYAPLRAGVSVLAANGASELYDDVVRVRERWRCEELGRQGQ